ncbi:MAG: DNA-processing protein DprA [Kiritimatiellae bacterium]|nr:DNA-processing protein DprA [Kiritimatiellia bacterium]
MPSRIWRCLEPDAAVWPQGWRDLGDPPARVFVTGQEQALRGKILAIVGTRGATPRGLAVARSLAGGLARRGWTIASGLALGIDAEAHTGALAVNGLTIAVMATGPERTYPSQHFSLRERIERTGCCVTESEPGGGAGGRWLFPRRNRLLAALARGVIVVEAPRRSGALLTAQLAVDLGRPVWAVPGPVDASASVGCHDLLRNGAALCTGCEDIDLQLPPPRQATELARPPLPQPGSAARWILDRIDLDGVALEELRARWPGTTAMWSEGMLALELAGLIRRLPGGRLAPRLWRA